MVSTPIVKQNVQMVHNGKIYEFPQNRTAEDVIDVLRLAQEHHHVQRIVEEGGAPSEGQEGHRNSICCAYSLAGADAPIQPVGTSIGGDADFCNLG